MDLRVPASAINAWVDRLPYIVLILFVVGTALIQQNQLTKKQGTQTIPNNRQMQMIGRLCLYFLVLFPGPSPSGLVVYFLTGNIFRIGQQALIVRLEENQKDKEKNKEKTKKKRKIKKKTMKTKKDQ